MVLWALGFTGRVLGAGSDMRQTEQKERGGHYRGGVERRTKAAIHTRGGLTGGLTAPTWGVCTARHMLRGRQRPGGLRVL